MDYEKTVENFLKRYPNYTNDINNFTDFIKYKFNYPLSHESITSFLEELDVDFLIDSLRYNVEKTEKYKKQSSAKRYTVVVSKFMEYIERNTNLSNRELYESISAVSKSGTVYMKRVTEYISQCEKLEATEKAGALNHEEAKRVLLWCNDQINTEWNNELAYRKAIASLGMKLMMIFGITYRELRKIRREQINMPKGTLFINGFNLRLPMELSEQISRLIKFQDENGLDNKQYSLLVNLNGKPWGEGTSSSGMPEYVSAIVGNRGLSSLIKYGIGQMIKTGINDSVIKRLTGASDKLLNGCILAEDEEWEKMLNNKIVTVELYYEF